MARKIMVNDFFSAIVLNNKCTEYLETSVMPFHCFISLHTGLLKEDILSPAKFVPACYRKQDRLV
jgi:hypothetical protein